MTDQITADTALPEILQSGSYRSADRAPRVQLGDFEPLPSGNGQYNLGFIGSAGAIVLGRLSAEAGAPILIGRCTREEGIDRLLQIYHRSRGEFDIQYLPISADDLELYLSRTKLQQADFSAYFPAAAGIASNSPFEREGSTPGPLENLIGNIITEAGHLQVRDMHIDRVPSGSGRIRIRRGTLTSLFRALDARLIDPLMRRIKLLAGMDVLRTDIPQEGSFVYDTRSSVLHIRVSSLPGAWGESLSLRFLRNAAELSGLTRLGFSRDLIVRLEELTMQSSGLLLFTGPTGSGKTTSIHGLISHCRPANRRIISIEDPVEIRNPLMEQIEMNEAQEMSFSRLLRRILRRAPDIIVIGEIRDEESARLAVRAALTGHLVISSMHCGGPEEAGLRLMDFGVGRAYIESVLLAVIGQQLGSADPGDSPDLKLHTKACWSGPWCPGGAGV